MPKSEGMRGLEGGRFQDDGVVFDVLQARLFKVGKHHFIYEENFTVQESYS